MSLAAGLAAAAHLQASIPSPPPEWSKFSIGPLTIHAYALCILAGIVAAIWLTDRRWKAKGGPDGTVWDICIWAIPFGIVGGRLYHVLVTNPAYYFGDGGAHLNEIWQIWLGGLGIMGAVALGAVGAWIACRRYGVRLSAFADAAAPGVLLAQAFGRWGNWFNQELFGKPTTLPWGLEIDATSHNFPAGLPAGTLFHPTFLYESLWNLAGVAILLLVDRRFQLRRGAMFWAYVAYYGLGRAIMESLRIDPAEVVTLFGASLRIHQWNAIALVVLGLAGMLFCLRRFRGKPGEDLYLPGRRPAEEAAPEGVPGTATIPAGGVKNEAGATGGAPADASLSHAPKRTGEDTSNSPD